MEHRPLLVGFNRLLVSDIDAILPPGSLTVVEEPDVYRKKDLARARQSLTCVGEVILAPYQQSDECLDPVLAAHAQRPFTAVVPGNEYAVAPTALIAERLGLPGAGTKAANTLSDKLSLRRVTTAAGMPGPRFEEVRSLEDVTAFVARASGRAVLKPSNRQASLGVTLIDSADEVAYAWKELVSAEEPRQVADRPWKHRYLVEERLTGPEYSVEALASEGELIFFNITQKTVAPGPHPVETGHLVPAPIPAPVREALLDSMRRLVDAVGYRTGILHAEWIVQDGQPMVIECAGRAPGDSISELISQAYGFNFVGAAWKLLAGDAPEPPSQALQEAAIAFLTSAPGIVTSVTGTDEARAVPGVVQVCLSVREGDAIPSLRNSWLGRQGYVLAVAPPGSAAGAAAAAVSHITITTCDG
ncbi:ATP-grasp domain-containing protein [Streptomyces sp. NRRL S-920]|uniref:ATP-grasp domain-containing protein n=1 Tax=Streptomyces sp. NRRL S-920 TaxID=1463921 RepID=UPI0004C8603C|nr:ATP-grasp domain-containing protein [Streptomyces sp. NRRL S-920]